VAVEEEPGGYVDRGLSELCCGLVRSPDEWSPMMADEYDDYADDYGDELTDEELAEMAWWPLEDLLGGSVEIWCEDE